MKIKDVCGITGLTDRTVRYYIECGLVFPDNNENYAGRRNFTFSSRDIERLEQIKTLRAAGFSIEQIKTMQEAEDTRTLVKARLFEIEQEQTRATQVYDALRKADIDRTVSTEELTIILSACDPVSAPVTTDAHPPRRKLAKWKQVIWITLIVLFGVLSIITALVELFNDSEWVSFGDTYFLLLDLAGILSIGMLATHRWSVKALIAAIVCFALIMLNLCCMVYHAPEEFTDITYQRIAKTAWDNEKVLENLGFEYFPEVDFWRYTEGDRNTAFLEITVERIHINEHNYLGVFPTHSERHEGMAVHDMSFVNYGNPFNRWICRPQWIRYDYTFYTSPMVINVYEDHQDGSTNLMFAEFIENIYAE